MEVLTWQAREQKGMSLQQLSEATNISRATLNNIENQQVSPNLEQLELLAAALDTKITALFMSKYK